MTGKRRVTNIKSNDGQNEKINKWCDNLFFCNKSYSLSHDH